MEGLSESGIGHGDVTREASSNEWRTDLHPEARRGIVDKLVDTLRKTSQASASGSSIDFEGNAAQCEETIYRNATSEADYLWTLSLKILEWEEERSDNWRLQLHHESRKRMVRKITETLRRCLPPSVPESEIEKIAMRFEEKIYSVASNQHDYLVRISKKMFAMERRSRGSS